MNFKRLDEMLAALFHFKTYNSISYEFIIYKNTNQINNQIITMNLTETTRARST